MPAPNPVIVVLREWLAKAENDLLNASHTLTLGADCPTDTVCFHAQQCVEKYIKALLVFRATPFTKTHNIHELRELLPPKLRPKLDRVVQDRLTRYATVRRYPYRGPISSFQKHVKPLRSLGVYARGAAAFARCGVAPEAAVNAIR